MAPRQIDGTLKKVNGAPLANADIYFELVANTFTVAPDATFPAVPLKATTDSQGRFTVFLEGGLDSEYEVTAPDGRAFRIIVDDGSPTTLEQLRALYTSLPIPLMTLEDIIEDLFAAGVPPVAVQEGGSPRVSPLDIINFDADHFDVTDAGSGQADVAIAPSILGHNHDTAYVNEGQVAVLIANAAAEILIDSIPFTNVATVTMPVGMFSALYEWYRVEIDILSMTTGSIHIQMRLRLAAADYAAAGTYNHFRYGITQAIAASSAASASDTLVNIGVSNTAATRAQMAIEMMIFQPFDAAQQTRFISRSSHSTASGGGHMWSINQGSQLGLASSDSFTFMTANASTMTGVARVYGRKTVGS